MPQDFVLDEGGGVSEYSREIKRTYHVPELLKSDKLLATTAGWCKEVTEVQGMLSDGKLKLGRPVLVLSTKGDEVLNFDDINELSGMLCEEEHLVEREIGTGGLEGDSCHDVLAANSVVRVDEAMGEIESFLKARFE